MISEDKRQGLDAGHRRVALIVAAVLFIGAVVAVTVLQAVEANTPQAKTHRSAQTALQQSSPQDKGASVTQVVFTQDGYTYAKTEVGGTSGHALFQTGPDGSLTLVASGTQLDNASILTELGVPADIQSKITGTSGGQTTATGQDPGPCGSRTIGYCGFDAVLADGQLQLYTSTVEAIEYRLDALLTAQNTGKPQAQQVTAVTAQADGSSQTETTTTIPLQFTQGDGTTSEHTLRIDGNPRDGYTYTLDGQAI